MKEIFQAALDLPGPDRDGFAQGACAGDAEVYREVISLLASAKNSTDFLTGDAGEYLPGVTEWVSDLPDGSRIGPYQLVRRIGAGGMGTVYLAERVDEFRQQVALKVMQRALASPAVVSQFRYERQLLAGLEHPNLARLLDGGTTGDGFPYFVMEYVEGEPIDTWCQQHGLTIRERLKLFREICAAVQYAHQNLIVHRDIKPANILVAKEGTPKLLDFGIAKMIRAGEGPSTAPLTELGVRLMTTDYASPEQVRGLPITTSTDVYSLGVVLYELLAGRRPYEFKTGAPGEIDQLVCEQEPLEPSAVAPALAGELTGDLDTIVLKALEKDPRRRYASVEQLSEDIRLHLETLPIRARRPTLGYRASRFVRRNRIPVAAGVLAIVSLAAGLAATSWQARIAQRERARAEKRFQEVRQLAESLMLDVDDKMKEGVTEARETLVAKALEYLNVLKRESAGDRALQLDLAEAYLRLGDLQGNPYSSSKGDPSGALARYDKALALVHGVLAKESHNAQALELEARAWRLRGDVQVILGKDEEALASARKSVDGFRALTAAFPSEAGYRTGLSEGWEAVGDRFNPGLSQIQDPRKAREAYLAALQVWDDILPLKPDLSRVWRARAVLSMKLGDAESYIGSEDAVRQWYGKALASIRETNLHNPENLSIESNIRQRLASLDAEKNPASAMAQYHAMIAYRENLLASDQHNSRIRIGLAIVLLEAAHVQETIRGGSAGAIDSYQRAVEVLAPVLEADPNDQRTHRMAADIGLQLGRGLARAGRKEQAVKASSHALGILKTLAERSPAPAQYSEYAEALLEVEPPSLRDPPAALHYAELASDSAKGGNPEFLRLVAEAHLQSGHAGAALDAGEKALSIMPAGSPERAQLERRVQEYRRAAKGN